MKTLKKLFALVATVATCLSLGATSVLAEGDSTTTTTGSITINNATGVYAAYQVFSGTYNSSTGTLGNITWGKDVTAFDFEIEKDGTKTTTRDAAKIAEYLATQENDSTVAQEFADAAESHRNGTEVSGTATAENGVAKITGLNYGYYLVKNTAVSDGKDSKGEQTSTAEAYTKFILKVVGDATATNKASVPSMTKKVKDTNDSTGVTSDWQDSADYDIGDAVPFQLTGTVASNYADYKTYYFAFHDVEEKGLTFDASSVKVKVDGTEITSGYTVNTSATDECTFEVVFSNLKDIESVHAGSVITVDYNSTLNESANIGSQGNVNKAKLEFSNNPNEEQSGETKPGTGETPWDNVIVFTYQTVVNKVDQAGAALAGAEFTLEKYDAATQTWVASKTATLNEAGTSFTFKGLDDGQYRLTESKTPAGYNTCAPIEFTVTAEHTIEWDGTDRTGTETKPAVLTSLKATGLSTDEISGDLTDGSITTNVVNKKGSVLPSTGGIGTTIFYVTGAILMLGAGVLLLSRRNSTSK